VLLLLSSLAVVTLADAVAMEATLASQSDTITEPLVCTVLFKVVQRVPVVECKAVVISVGFSKLHRSWAKQFKEPLRWQSRDRFLSTNEMRRPSV
jgi:hypothetical protein